MTAPTHVPSMEQHPDIVELRARYERAAVTPFGQGLEALAIVVGLFLAVSPWVVGFSGLTTLAAANLITGVAYAVLIGGFGPAFERSHARGWAATAIGLWTVIAPWSVAGDVATTRTVISNVITGALALCLALAMCSLARTDARRLARQTEGTPRPAGRLFHRTAPTPPAARGERPGAVPGANPEVTGMGDRRADIGRDKDAGGRGEQ
ncbi:SPW repeat protein [Streptomyces halobius]|uniref:SPW repeat protein n=1 Tax=Streptomyces halobius TaxID=2879846 RepID=UPI0029E7E20F|nr:SPW repeat protein [Streptomyces halobius]